MRAQKITNAGLAEDLKVSTATIKRFFSGNAVTLERLRAVCERLNIPLSEIAAHCEQDFKSASFHFTLTQEAAIAEESSLLSYFLQLQEGLSPAVIAKKFELNKLSTRRYLSQLEKLGLIKSVNDDKITIPKKYRGRFKPRYNGPFRKRFLEKFLSRMSSHFLDRFEGLPNSGDPEGGDYLKFGFLFQITEGAITNETYHKMLIELKTIVHSYLQKAETEAKVSNAVDSAKPFVIGVMADRYLQPQFSHLLDSPSNRCKEVSKK